MTWARICHWNIPGLLLCPRPCPLPLLWVDDKAILLIEMSLKLKSALLGGTKRWIKCIHLLRSIKNIHWQRWISLVPYINSTINPLLMKIDSLIYSNLPHVNVNSTSYGESIITSHPTLGISMQSTTWKVNVSFSSKECVDGKIFGIECRVITSWFMAGWCCSHKHHPTTWLFLNRFLFVWILDCDC